MEAKKIVSLICRIVGREKINRRQREELTSLIALITSAKQDKPAEPVQTGKVVEEPNTMAKEEPNTIDLSVASAFDIPKDINIEFEGQEGLKKIKIFPDGISETPVETPVASA